MICVSLPDNFSEAELMQFFHPLEMYFLWFGGELVKGFKYSGEHVLDLPLNHDHTIFRAKITISTYLKDFKDA